MIYFCADDYGISKEYNKCIEECVDKGILNKVSVMPNGEIKAFVEMRREEIGSLLAVADGVSTY